MRTEQEMMDAVLGFARRDERIRVVGMEGSRTNIHAPRDEFQDYDISFLVTDMASFQQSDNWLDAFGPRIILQKPEAMELFAPELGNWFSYLMLFRDGAKMDLTLVPLEELPLYPPSAPSAVGFVGNFAAALPDSCPARRVLQAGSPVPCLFAADPATPDMRLLSTAAQAFALLASARARRGISISQRLRFPFFMCGPTGSRATVP